MIADALSDGKIALARAVGALSRRGGRGGTSLPGKVLMRLDSDAVARLSSRLPRGSVLVSATNGKTTTAAMAARILEEASIPLVHNRAGANMGGGIASTLLAAARPGGRIDGELGLFEVDEFWLEQMVTQLRPRHLLLGNLFRDQLDRYGELETIADRWAAMLRSPGRRRRRPRRERRRPARSPTSAATATASCTSASRTSALALPATRPRRRRQALPPLRGAVLLRRRSTSAISATTTASSAARRGRPRRSRPTRSSSTVPAGRASSCTRPPGERRSRSPCPVCTTSTTPPPRRPWPRRSGIPLATIVAGLQATRAAFGRAETLRWPGEPVRILLIKNPAGANEVLRTLTLEEGELDLLAVLNDNIADGRDVSWVWDADFEALAPRVRRVTCSGTRAAELALRLKYAGVPTERIAVHDALDDALDAAVSDRSRTTRRCTPCPHTPRCSRCATCSPPRGVVASSWA